MRRTVIALFTVALPFGCHDAPPDREIPSLKGAAADCDDVAVGADGHLVADSGLRRCFDHYLTGVGEVSDDRVRDLVGEELGRRLPPAAAREGREAYDDYVAYLKDASAVVATAGDLGEAQANLRSRQEGLLGTAFFEDEGRRLRRVLEALEGRALDGRRPGELPGAPGAPVVGDGEEERVYRASQAVALMRRLGRSEAEVDRYREDTFGAAAAQRLRALDRARADFERRYADYRAARAALGASPSHAEVEGLIEARFQGPERIRVRALDRIR